MVNLSLSPQSFVLSGPLVIKKILRLPFVKVYCAPKLMSTLRPSPEAELLSSALSARLPKNFVISGESRSEC